MIDDREYRIISTSDDRYIIKDLETELEASGGTIDEAKKRLYVALKNARIIVPYDTNAS